LTLVAVAVAACGDPTGGPSTDEVYSLHSDSGVCDLRVVVESKQGVIEGTVVSVETGFEGGLPWDVPGREYAIAQVKIESALEPALEPGSEEFFEPLQPGSTLGVLSYPDVVAAPVDELSRLAETGKPVVILLASTRNWDDPSSKGMWRAARVIDVAGSSAMFLGGCADTVNADFEALAKELGRPADKELLLDFADETLRTVDQATYNPGPIEMTLLDMWGMLPLPTDRPPASTVEE
jgi:hypothetical protein